MDNGWYQLRLVFNNTFATTEAPPPQSNFYSVPLLGRLVLADITTCYANVCVRAYRQGRKRGKATEDAMVGGREVKALYCIEFSKWRWFLRGNLGQARYNATVLQKPD